MFAQGRAVPPPQVLAEKKPDEREELIVLQGQLPEPNDQQSREVPPDNPGSRIRDLVPVIACAISGLSILLGVEGIEGRGGRSGDLGASFWPQAMGVLFLVCATVILTTTLLLHKKPIEHPEKPSKQGLINFVITVGVLYTYSQTFRVLPFWLTTFVVSAGLLWLFGIRAWKGVLIFPAVITLILQLLFVTALRVPL